MKIYLVGDEGPEHCNVIKVFFKYENALAFFQEHRKDILKQMAELKEYWQKEDPRRWAIDMYDEMITKLSDENPRTIDNYPHETPFIREMELSEPKEEILEVIKWETS